MEILEILKYTIPALIVFFTTLFTIRTFVRAEEKRNHLKIVLRNKELITPLRLQAYERIILFLERISPEALIMRLNKPKMNVRQLQTEMLRVIRTEFDHNLSQQLYLSPKAWGYVVNSKSKLINFINSTAGKLNPAAPSIKYSTMLLEALMEDQKSPTQQAIIEIKKEIARLF